MNNQKHPGNVHLFDGDLGAAQCKGATVIEWFVMMNRDILDASQNCYLNYFEIC